MNRFGLLSILVGVPLLSCTPKAEDDPTWVDDIRPMLLANCVRCHGAPARGGAPAEFRLDRYEDQELPDGRTIRGAATMAEYIKSRGGTLGDMPPDRPRTDEQRDTLAAWFDQAIENGTAPALGERSGNAAPSAELAEDPGVLDQEAVELLVQVNDPDGDPASGELLLDGELLSNRLATGRTAVSLDPSVLAEGAHTLTARLSDDLLTEEVEVGTLMVEHAAGNAAPKVALPSNLRDGLFTDRDQPLPLTFAVEDADGDAVTLTISAVRDGEEIGIVEALPVNEGVARLNWNLARIPSDDTWRMRVVATDGTQETELVSEPFIVSHLQSELTFADVQTIFQDKCSVCHPGKQLPGLDFDLSQQPSVESLRGIIYRRVVRERNMPPQSAYDILFSAEPLSQQELDTLEEYLLSGAAPAPTP